MAVSRACGTGFATLDWPQAKTRHRAAKLETAWKSESPVRSDACWEKFPPKAGIAN
jgi:hypothetical protein